MIGSLNRSAHLASRILLSLIFIVGFPLASAPPQAETNSRDENGKIPC
jgi:hypothetical protein